MSASTFEEALWRFLRDSEAEWAAVVMQHYEVDVPCHLFAFDEMREAERTRME